ncbi:MAG: site-specific DNA-methyltransferase, partial [Bacteroidota bacterium]|nr:site-specific DNA-methyltransferase [Bacteroidota bacterium]
MTGNSLDIVQNQLEKLRQLFPEAITEGKIDWEKLQATLGKENLEFQNERYVLNWAGKTDAFKVLQLSTTATLKPCPGEGINDFPVFNNHGNHENQINHSSDNV